MIEGSLNKTHLKHEHLLQSNENQIVRLYSELGTSLVLGEVLILVSDLISAKFYW